MSQQKLANVVHMGDDTASAATLQAKKVALTAALAALDGVSVAIHFLGTDHGARIANAQAVLRSLIAEPLEHVTARLAGNGVFTSP